jgi:hypothetical protein
MGLDGSLHFTVPSMNRLNQTEPATFTILPCWAFFRDSNFLYFVYLKSDPKSDRHQCSGVSAGRTEMNTWFQWDLLSD